MKKTNKIISALLVLVMMLTMAPLTAFARNEPSTVEIGGITYYKIRNAVDLDWFASQVNSGNTEINGLLTADIEYNSGTVSASTAGANVWTPIGSRENPFSGIFNGQGYTISGLYSKDPDENPYLALFACTVDATIANVAVKNFYFESTYGLCAGIVSYSAGTRIYNCYAQGSIYAKDAGGAAAGICAAVFGHDKTEIISCLADVSLKVDDPSDFSVIGPNVRNYIGGIICMGDKNNPVFIQNSVYITDRYSGSLYSQYALPADFTIYDSEGMPASKLATGEITYILGDGWGQKLGEDSVPEIGNENLVDYGYVSCDADAQKVYTNSATNPNYPDHYDSETDSDVACDFCGANLHVHSFEYTVNENVITATCVADGCTLENGNGGMLKIQSPMYFITDGVTPNEAIVYDTLVEPVDYTVTYSTADGNPPITAGTYTASLSFNGLTASVEFTLRNYVATVTDKDGNELEGSPYITLEDAVWDASYYEDSTVTLLEDVELSEYLSINYGKITLDLNGKTLSSNSDVISMYGPDAELTIVDSGEDGKIVVTSDETFPSVFYISSSTLNIVDGTFILNPGGSMPSIIDAYSDAEINIYGGEFFGTDCDGFYCYESTLNIYGGSINLTSSRVIYANESEVNICGGRIASGNSYEATISSSDSNVSVSGGEFVNKLDIFSDDTEFTLNAILAEGFAYYDADGNKIYFEDNETIYNGYVQVKDNYVAQVIDKNGNLIDSYKTIEDAIAAASDNDGSTLALLEDIYVTELLFINYGDFTIDFNGKKIIGQINRVFQLKEDAVVTFKDSAEGGTIEALESGAAAIYNLGTLTVESITVKGDGGIENSGTLTVTDCTVIADYYEAVINSGTAYIYSGSFTSAEKFGLTNQGTAYVYGGEYSGISNSGTAYISGGKVRRDDYAALNLIGGTCEITGGSFSGTDFETGFITGTPYGEWTVYCFSDATLTIKGGVFPNGFSVMDESANQFLADGCFFRDEYGNVIYVDDESNYVSGYVTVSVGADLTEAVITLDSYEFFYTGEEIVPEVSVKVGNKTLVNGTDYTLTYADNVNAGYATVTVNGLGVYEGSVETEFLINKVDAEIEVYPEANELIYNGSAQALITAGSVVYGTMLYSIDGEEFSEDIPEYTDAGTYYVYYKVEGDSNHNDVDVEVIEVKIGKKPVTASATVADKVYDGTRTVDSSAINITFDGIVDGDDVVIDKCVGMLLGANAGNNKTVQIAYWVSGEDVGNYEFYEDGVSIPEKEYYYIETKANILPKDISNAQITLGDALTYNGTEQTQSIASFTVDGLDITYTVSGNTATNVGVYELTITGNGNFTGTKTVAFEIAPDTSAIDALTVDNVKSSDKEAIEAVINQIENADTENADEDKVSEYNQITEKCNELLAKISETEEKLEEMGGVENNYNPETVTSDDKAEIEEIIAEIESVNPENLTDEQKAEYDEIKAGFEALLEKINEAGSKVDAVGAELEMFDKERVTVFWEDDIEALKAEIDELLADENMGEAEKARLNEYKAQCDELIEIINAPVKYFSMRFFYLIADAFSWLINFFASLLNITF